MRQRLAGLGLAPRDLHAVLLSWDYISLISLGLRSVAEHFPGSLGLTRKGAITGWDVAQNGRFVRKAPGRLARQLGLP